MKINFIIPVIMCLVVQAPAVATVKLRGRVSESESDHPIPGVIVSTRSAFTTTDRSGTFTLITAENDDSVTFRAMGYQTLTLPIGSGLVNVRLTVKATQLNDVIVKAPDIYAKGDTLVFNVAQYANAKDNAIVDVIKRLPGIKVEDDGTIKYQGKEINKFYIDGNDFIGDQYGLATNNISHKDVKAVEIMEHHQPIKALDGIEFPEEAGINLKLKEDARGRWVGVLTGGCGYEPWQGTGSVYAMRLAPKIQNVITIKGDNTGWNPDSEVREHEFDNLFSGGYTSELWSNFITANVVNSPLPEKRTRNNLSSLANNITAWRCGDNAMRLKLNYASDRLDYQTSAITDYLNSSIPSFSQTEALRTQKHQASAQFNSEINKQGYYLKDRLMATFLSDGSHADISGSKAVTQDVASRTLELGNDTKLVKRTDRRMFTITSRNTFSQNSDNLEIPSPSIYSQQMDRVDLRSTTECDFGIFRKYWKYYISTGIDLNHHHLNSTLTGANMYSNSANIDNTLYETYLTPHADYMRGGWRLSLGVPVKLQLITLRSAPPYISISPQMSAKYQLNSKSELSASCFFKTFNPNLSLFLNTPIMTDYRNITVPSTNGKQSHATGGSMSWQYRNPIHSFFANLNASYMVQKNSMLTNQIFEADRIIALQTEQFSISRHSRIEGGVSKGVDHGKMVVGCDIAASITAASSMRNNAIIPFQQNAYSIKPFLRGSISRWLAMNYSGSFNLNTMSVAPTSTQYIYLHNTIFATLMPHNKIDLTLSAEHILNSIADNTSTTYTSSGINTNPDTDSASTPNKFAGTVLIDATATWRATDRLRLSLSASNLCNQQNYRYTTYGTLSRTEITFPIRPRTLLLTCQLRF